MIKAMLTALLLMLLVSACSPVMPPHPRITVDRIATNAEPEVDSGNMLSEETPYLILFTEDGTVAEGIYTVRAHQRCSRCGKPRSISFELIFDQEDVPVDDFASGMTRLMP